MVNEGGEVMRKWFCGAAILMCLMAMVTAGCQLNASAENDKYIELGETVHDIRKRYNEPYTAWGLTRVYQIEEDVYQLVIFNLDAKVDKSIEIIPGEGTRNAQGFIPIRFEEPEHYLGLTLEELEVELGPYHVSAGVKGFRPGYISDGGYLICFSVRNSGIVDFIEEHDMLQNKYINTWHIDSE